MVLNLALNIHTLFQLGIVNVLQFPLDRVQLAARAGANDVGGDSARRGEGAWAICAGRRPAVRQGEVVVVVSVGIVVALERVEDGGAAEALSDQGAQGQDQGDRGECQRAGFELGEVPELEAGE